MAKKKKNKSNRTSKHANKTPVIKEKNVTANPYIFGIAVLGLIIIALIFFIWGSLFKNKGTGGTSTVPNQNGNITKEIENFENRLKSNPEDLQTTLKLAHLYLEGNQYDKAEELYDNVLKLDSRNVEAVTHIGNIEERRQNITTAIEKYDQALKMQSDYAHALWDKGLLMKSLGRYEESIALFERFLKLTPEGQDADTVTKWIKEMRVAN